MFGTAKNSPAIQKISAVVMIEEAHVVVFDLEKYLNYSRKVDLSEFDLARAHWTLLLVNRI
jgi:hypothetical protein